MALTYKNAEIAFDRNLTELKKLCPLWNEWTLLNKIVNCEPPLNPWLVVLADYVNQYPSVLSRFTPTTRDCGLEID